MQKRGEILSNEIKRKNSNYNDINVRYLIMQKENTKLSYEKCHKDSLTLERYLKEQIHLSHFARDTRKRTYGEW